MACLSMIKSKNLKRGGRKNEEKRGERKKMKKILFQNIRKTIMSVIFLLAVSNITLLPVLADTQRVLCMHPQAKSIDEPATEYTRDVNSYCLSYKIYQKWSCPDCGSRWLSENNEYTEPHSWSEAPNIQTIDRSKSTNAICYKLIVCWMK